MRLCSEGLSNTSLPAVGTESQGMRQWNLAHFGIALDAASLFFTARADGARRGVPFTRDDHGAMASFGGFYESEEE